MRNVFLLIACLVMLVQFSNAQQSKIDSLKNLLTTLPSDTNRVNVLNELSFQYWTSDPAAMKLYADQAIALAHELNYVSGIAKIHTTIGAYFWSQKQTQEALAEYQKALQMYQQLNDVIGIARCYGNMGMVYKDMGNYPLSMDYYLKALKVGEAKGDQKLIANLLTYIGTLLKAQGRYEEALDYITRSKATWERVGQVGQQGVAGSFHNLGEIYYELRQYEKAIEYLNQGLELFSTLKDLYGQVLSANSLGKVYFELGQYQKAETYHQKALAFAEEKGYSITIISALQGIAAVELQKGLTSEAITFYQRSLQLAEEKNLGQQKLKAYEGLTQAYTQRAEFENALTSQSKLLALKDSLFNEENNKKTAQLQANYEVEKKQVEIDLLQKDQQQAALVRNFMLAGILGVFLMAALVVSRQRLKIRQNRMLLEKSKEVAHKNELLEAQAQVLASQTAKLREMDEAKSRFFANISHEFRTPLTIILNNLSDKIEQVQKPEGNAQELSQLQVMHRNARRLLQLINQLLDLSKLESGKMKIELQDGDLKQFLSVVSASFSSLADFRHILLELSLPDEPLLCRFDADKLEKILYNLLSNAFKFTPNGGKIRLEMKRLSLAGKAFIQLSVQDSGPGIASEQLQHVFDRFYQGKQYYADEQGTGIGLALTKELVDLHEGQIWAESKAGQGTTFFVQLPLLSSAPEAEEIKTSLELGLHQEQLLVDEILPAEDNPLAKSSAPGLPLLLVVEDNQDLRAYIRKHLENQYEVVESENGREGLEKATRLIPDLIITDRMMPEMDGLELCLRLKEDERTSHIPLIMLTALATDEGKLKGLETGADEYLTKPFDRRELDIRIRNLIESRRKLRERYSKVLQLEPTNIEVSSADDIFLQKVLKVVEEYMGDAEFSTEEFGRQVGLSRMQLHRKLKALTGQTPGDLLRMMRLKRAAQFLDRQAGNISEIAYQVGFNNLSYFAKCFRDQFGMNPNEYISRQAASPME